MPLPTTISSVVKLENVKMKLAIIFICGAAILMQECLSQPSRSWAQPESDVAGAQSFSVDHVNAAFQKGVKLGNMEQKLKRMKKKFSEFVKGINDIHDQPISPNHPDFSDTKPAYSDLSNFEMFFMSLI